LCLGRIRTICREPAAKPVHAECQALSSRLILLPLRGRSRDKPRSYRDCVNLTFLFFDLSHAPRGNAATDAPRHRGRGASWQACPRGAWVRSTCTSTRYLWETSEVTRAANAVGQVPQNSMTRCIRQQAGICPDEEEGGIREQNGLKTVVCNHRISHRCEVDRVGTLKR
jgi:hypothetical protein